MNWFSNLRKFLKWEDLSDYEKNLVEVFLVEAQDKIEKLDKNEDIADNLVKQIEMESVNQIGYQKEGN